MRTPPRRVPFRAVRPGTEPFGSPPFPDSWGMGARAYRPVGKVGGDGFVVPRTDPRSRDRHVPRVPPARQSPGPRRRSDWTVRTERCRSGPGARRHRPHHGHPLRGRRITRTRPPERSGTTRTIAPGSAGDSRDRTLPADREASGPAVRRRADSHETRNRWGRGGVHPRTNAANASSCGRHDTPADSRETVATTESGEPPAMTANRKPDREAPGVADEGARQSVRPRCARTVDPPEAWAPGTTATAATFAPPQEGRPRSPRARAIRGRIGRRPGHTRSDTG